MRQKPYQIATRPLNYEGPSLVISRKCVTRQLFRFRSALPGIRVHFAVKANPWPPLLQHLNKLGCHFEIASQGELHLMQQLNIAGERIIFSNPVKTPQSIVAAYRFGVRWFAFDSHEELLKLQQLAPAAHYELRLHTSGAGAVWPLSKKFGANSLETIRLLSFAAANHIKVEGLTFHVGSQCHNNQSWLDGLQQCRGLIQHMHDLHMPLKMINIGGGFPAPINENVPRLKDLSRPIATALSELPKDIDLVAEPGRYLAAPAGVLTCQVIATRQQGRQQLAYLDCGYYNGLMELNAPFGYQLQSRRSGKLVSWQIAGPTCDSIDMFQPHYLLPYNTQCGDLIDIPFMGAYCHGCTTEFNGFDTPEIYLAN